MMPPRIWLAAFASAAMVLAAQPANARPASDEDEEGAEEEAASEEEEESSEESSDESSDEEEEKTEAHPQQSTQRTSEPPEARLAAAQATVEPKSAASDHDMWVGHVGVSWFGVSNVPIATGTPGGTGDTPAVNPGAPTFVPAPAIGIRYWFSSLAGLDLGAGMSMTTGSVATTTYGADKAMVTAFLLHLGVPLSLVEGQHISLQLTPELNAGYATSSVEPSAQPDPPVAASLSGFRIDVGARVGAELYWGFIGVPQLALEGSVGLFVTHQGTDITVDTAHASQNDLVITTGEYQSPWDLFTQHIRARYYF